MRRSLLGGDLPDALAQDLERVATPRKKPPVEDGDVVPSEMPLNFTRSISFNSLQCAVRVVARFSCAALHHEL